MTRYRREVEEHRVYDDGPVGPVGRPVYGNPAAWIIAGFIVLLLILLLVFGLNRAGNNGGPAPVVREPAPAAPANNNTGNTGNTGNQETGEVGGSGGGEVGGQTAPGSGDVGGGGSAETGGR